MDDTKKLAFILKFLNEEWDKLTPMMSEDQLALLQNELEGLETKLLVASKKPEKTVEVVKNFFPVFSTIGPLEFLSRLEAPTVRSMSTDTNSTKELEDDIADLLLTRLRKLKERYDQ